MSRMRKILAEEGLVSPRAVEARGPGYVGASILKAVDQLEKAMGGIEYRIWDVGKRDIVLSDREVGDLEVAHSELEKAQKELQRIYRGIRGINLNFSG